MTTDAESIPRLVAASKAAQMVGVSSQRELRKLADEGLFPALIQLSPKRWAVPEADLREWIDARMAERQVVTR